MNASPEPTRHDPRIMRCPWCAEILYLTPTATDLAGLFSEVCDCGQYCYRIIRDGKVVST